MTEYEIKLKRKGAPVIKITVEGSKFTLSSGTALFNSTRTCSTILAIIDTMKSEGLEWIRVDEK